MINLVLVALKNNREDTKFTDIFNRAVSKAGVLNIDVKIPRICKRQAHRSNLTTSSTEEYFKITVYLLVTKKCHYYLLHHLNNPFTTLDY